MTVSPLPSPRVVAAVDYTSKDYDAFVESMLDYAARVFPEWTGRSQSDMGVALIESFAYMGDILSYYGDRIAQEAFIGTATQRSSVFNHADMLGYSPYGYGPATGTVTFQTDPGQATPVVVPAGTVVATDYVDQYDSPIYYETNAQVTVPATAGTISVGVTQGQYRGDTTKTLYTGQSNVTNVSVVQIGISTGLADQKFFMPEAPVINSTVRVFTDDPAAVSPAVVEYQPITSLLEASPSDLMMQVKFEDSGRTSVTFGDGLNGVIPAAGAKIYARYRAGGGVKGNIGAGLVKFFYTTLTGVVIPTSTAMTGGYDAESLDSIRKNAPLAYSTQNRCVTLEDYENTALGVTGVAKAKAVAASAASIKIFIGTATGMAATQTLTDSVVAAIEPLKMVGTTVTVSAASSVFVNVGTSTTPVRVGVVPRFGTADIQRAVGAAMENVLRYDNVVLDQRLAVSTMYAAAQAVPGVAYVVIPMMARSTDAQTGVADIQCREWEYPAVGAISIAAEIPA